MPRSATQQKAARTPGVIEGTGAPVEAGEVFWQREGGFDTTRCDSQNLGAVMRQKHRSKLQGRTCGQARATAKGRAGAGEIL